MRLGCCLVIAVAGCGRIAFDELGGVDGPPDVAPLTCSSAFASVNGAPLAYLFESTRVDWSTARAACDAFGPGHALALPTADAERLALADTARSLVLDRWWLGGTDVAVEGTWVDTAGAPIVYQPWAMFEPNNTGGNENCLDLLADPVEGVTRTDLFDDRACTALYPYICACTL